MAPITSAVGDLAVLSTGSPRSASPIQDSTTSVCRGSNLMSVGLRPLSQLNQTHTYTVVACIAMACIVMAVSQLNQTHTYIVMAYIVMVVVAVEPDPHLYSCGLYSYGRCPMLNQPHRGALDQHEMHRVPVHHEELRRLRRRLHTGILHHASSSRWTYRQK